MSQWLSNPPLWAIITAATGAALCISWSAYWAVRDIREWWTGRASEDDPPPFISTWSLDKADSLPFRRLISLRNAAISAYPKIRKRADVQVLERLSGSDPAKIPGLVAQMLLNHPSFNIPLYGTYPPINVFEKIPEEDARQFRFSDDATQLVGTFNGNHRYRKLAIKRRDLKRRIRELAE